MRYLKAIELQNIVCYNEARFPLDRRGLTCIYGRNHDGGLDDKKSNGAGKSLLFTMIAETLKDENPLLEGRHVAKESFFRRDAMSAVEFDDYRITKQLSGKTVKFDLFKLVNGNWKPSKVRTNTYVTSKMQELLPISADEFFTLYYIDSNRPSVLQKGSHTDRLKLFSKLFHLDKYDMIQAEVKERQKVMRKLDQELTNVLNQIAVIEPQIAPDLATKVEELAEKQAKQKKLNVRRTEANRLLNLATTYQAHAKTLVQLDAYWSRLATRVKVKGRSEADWLDPEFLQEFISAGNEGMVNNKKLLNRAYEQQAATHKIDDARARVAKLTQKTKGWTLAKVKQAIAEAREHADAASDHKAEVKEINRQISQLVEQVPPAIGFDKARAQLKGLFPDVPFEKLLATARDAMNGAQAIFDMAQRSEKNFRTKFDQEDCECPTCHAQLEAETIKEIGKNLRATLKAKEEALGEATANFELAKETTAWVIYTNEQRTLSGRLDELLNATVEQDGPDLETLTDVRQALTDLAREQEALAELEELVEGDPLDAEALSELRMDLKQALLDANSVLQARRALQDAVDANADEYDVDDLTEGLAKVDTTMTRLMQDVPALMQQVSVGQAKQRELKVLKAKQRDLEDKLFDQAPLKVLDEAYGQKGLKNLAIQRYAAIIESNLNIDAALLLAEKMKFEIKVSETELHILAHREYDGEKSDGDIRRFSGAESRAINMLLAKAILPLIPSNRRLNIMALDEPTANLDEPAIELFTDKFLPKLLELVPHVIVLSPQRLQLDIEAETWCVTREKGRSILAKEG